MSEDGDHVVSFEEGKIAKAKTRGRTVVSAALGAPPRRAADADIPGPADSKKRDSDEDTPSDSTGKTATRKGTAKTKKPPKEVGGGKDSSKDGKTLAADSKKPGGDGEPPSKKEGKKKKDRLRNPGNLNTKSLCFPLRASSSPVLTAPNKRMQSAGERSLLHASCSNSTL